MKVTFIDHSGAMIEIGNKLLVFDYVKGQISLPLDKEIYLFISHGHSDHYNSKLFDIKHPNLSIIYDKSIGDKGHYPVVSHHSYIINDLNIKTLKSNDSGVGFIVEVDGKRILFPGDLHAWNWPLDDSDTEEDIKEVQSLVQAYNDELNIIKQYHYDLVFILVDYRLKEHVYDGLKLMNENVSFDYWLPIHFWNDFDSLSRLDNDLVDKGLIVSKEKKEFNI